MLPMARTSPARSRRRPGDFQLVQRSDLFEIDGFDERMILGWHVDSNLAKRLSLRCGPVASLIEHVF